MRQAVHDIDVTWWPNRGPNVYRKLVIGPDTGVAGIEDVLRECDASHGHCHFAMLYTYQSGHEGALSIRYRAPSPATPGEVSHKSGQIRCRITESNLLTPVAATPAKWQFYESTLNCDLLLDSLRGQPAGDELEAATSAIADNLVEIILRGVDAIGSSTPGGVRHAGVSFVEEWATPLTSSIAFHRDRDEFPIDFARMLLHADCDIDMSTTFDQPDTPIWELWKPRSNDRYAGVRLQSYSEYACYPSEPTPARVDPIMRFMAQFHRERAERLSRVDGREMWDLLVAAAAETPRAFSRTVGEGALIGVHPYTNLRNVYFRAAEMTGLL